MALDSETGDILLAREDAIHTHGPRGRGPSYAYDGPKTSLSIFRGYVALVCPPRTSASKAESLRTLGVSQADDIFNTATLALLDTDLKFIAHTESLHSPAKNVFTIWGDLFLNTIEGKVCGSNSLVLCLTKQILSGISLS
jgi:vacuolar protein sorting-associated protein 11